MKLTLPPHHLEGKHVNRYHLALFVVLLAAIFLRLPWMSVSLWYDEISVTNGYLKNVFHLLDAWTYDSNMPVHYTLMFFWNKLFPDTEFSLRFLPLFFGLASIVLAYQVARIIFDSQVGLLSAFLLAISPVHIWYSTEARPYAGMMFFLQLAILCFLKLIGDPALSTNRRRFWLLTYFVAMFLGTFSHFYMAIPAVVLSIITFFQKSPLRIKILLINGVIFLGLLCFFSLKYLLAGYFPVGAGYLRPFSALEGWQLLFNWFPTGNAIAKFGKPFSWKETFAHPVILISQIFFCALLIKGIVNILTEPKSDGKFLGLSVLAFLFCIPLFLLAVNFVGLHSTYVERSAVVAIPFFMMVVSRGVLALRRNVFSLALAAAVVILSGISVFLFFRDFEACPVASCKQDWRSSAKYLTADIGEPREKAAVVAMLHPRSLPYYDSRFEDHVRLERLVRHLPRIYRMLERYWGVDNAIGRTLGVEIAEAKNQLRHAKEGKIAVYSFAEILKKDVDYDNYYALENPDNPRRAKEMLNWLRRRRDLRIAEKREFISQNIYKFVRK